MEVEGGSESKTVTVKKKRGGMGIKKMSEWIQGRKLGSRNPKKFISLSNKLG